MNLGKDQTEAIRLIKDWALDPSQNRFFTLLGSAGTGKTSCLKVLFKDLKLRTVFTAPTNKATKILYSVLSDGTFKPTCRTIYSLLGCAMTAEGEIEVLSIPEDPVDLKDVDLIVVDEASMVNEALFDLITQKTPENVKVLFVGDPYQLPPVKESKSKTWEVQNSFELKEIFRNQGHILDQVLAIKAAIGVFGASFDIKSRPVDGNPFNYEVYKIPQSTASKETARIFTEIINSGDMVRPNMFKVVAWRNITVAKWNDIIRKLLWQSNAVDLPAWLPGDRCVIASIIKSEILEGKTVASVDDEGTIQEVLINNHPIYSDILCFILKIAIDDGAVITAYVIHPEAKNYYDRTLTEKLIEAKKDKAKWKSFWAFKKAFNDVRYGYAITAHRSQGSTYHTVLVDFSDILVNRTRVEALKCLYVAASRPTTRLILI